MEVRNEELVHETVDKIGNLLESLHIPMDAVFDVIAHLLVNASVSLTLDNPNQNTGFFIAKWMDRIKDEVLICCMKAEEGNFDLDEDD